MQTSDFRREWVWTFWCRLSAGFVGRGGRVHLAELPGPLLRVGTNRTYMYGDILRNGRKCGPALIVKGLARSVILDLGKTVRVTGQNGVRIF